MDDQQAEDNRSETDQGGANKAVHLRSPRLSMRPTANVVKLITLLMTVIRTSIGRVESS